MKGRTTRKMLDKLRSLGVKLSSEAVIRRVYAGRHQRAAGAWSWFVYDPERPALQLGSQFSCTELLRCPSVDVSFHSSSGNNVDCNCIGRCKGKA